MERDANTPRVLVVEDERTIAETLLYALKTEAFTAEWAATLSEARTALQKSSFDLLILDVGLPDGSGLEFCKTLRQTSQVPVLMLTARSSEIDRIVGLEIGADDYVAKPFSPREVTARVKAILKRSQVPREISTGSSRKVPRPFRWDEEKKKIYFGDHALELGRYEYGLLGLLLSRPGQVFSREQLMERVWADPDMSLDRTVDAHVKMLRQKLKAAGAEDDWIQTHRGMGYSLKEEGA